MADEFCLKMRDFHACTFGFFNTSHLRHGTNGFTSLPKEGVLRIFSSWKIRRLRPGLNPRTWVPKTSTLPLDHGSRCNYHHTCIWIFKSNTRYSHQSLVNLNFLNIFSKNNQTLNFIKIQRVGCDLSNRCTDGWKWQSPHSHFCEHT